VVGVEGDLDTVPEEPALAEVGDSAALLGAATRVLETMTGSRYAHHTQIGGGEYDVDCSGFVDYLLARVNAPALAELRSLSVKRPLAKHFVAVLASETPKRHWSRVPTVAELTPGDLIAWDKPADVISTNTGHVMIVAAAPELVQEARWKVSIVDSSASPHGSHDARHASQTTGIGRGAIILEIGSNGEPIAYHWSIAKTSPRHDTRIVLARIR